MLAPSLLALWVVAAAPFDGVYESTYGRVRFARDGDRVEGTYAYGGGSTFAGRVEGARLVLRYREPGGVEGSATLAGSGDTFAGTWRADDGSEGAWEGARVEEESGAVWLVVLETPWEESFEEREYSFGEMLRTYFARFPQVEVRHRRIRTREDLLAAARDATYLVEPSVLLISGHGDAEGLLLGDTGVPPEALGEILARAPRLRAVHFSSCSVLSGDYGRRLADAARAPVSGYSEDVEWTVSALAEFLYLEHLLDSGMTPRAAVEATREEFRSASSLRVDDPRVP